MVLIDKSRAEELKKLQQETYGVWEDQIWNRVTLSLEYHLSDKVVFACLQYYREIIVMSLYLIVHHYGSQELYKQIKFMTRDLAAAYMDQRAENFWCKIQPCNEFYAKGDCHSLLELPNPKFKYPHINVHCRHLKQLMFPTLIHMQCLMRLIVRFPRIRQQQERQAYIANYDASFFIRHPFSE